MLKYINMQSSHYNLVGKEPHLFLFMHAPPPSSGQTLKRVLLPKDDVTITSEKWIIVWKVLSCTVLIYLFVVFASKHS